MTGHARCPSFDELSLAFSRGLRTEGAAEGQVEPLALHVAECASCRGVLADLARLKEAARSLPFSPVSAEQVQAEEARLFARAAHERRITQRRARWSQAASLLAAASAAAVALYLWTGQRADDRHRVVLSAAESAQVEHFTEPRTGGGREEVVRVKSGRLALLVPQIPSGEHVRLVTADARIEVQLSAFEVEVDDGRLASVQVQQGELTVYRADVAPLILRAGDRWEAARPAEHAVLARDAEVEAPPAGVKHEPLAELLPAREPAVAAPRAEAPAAVTLPVPKAREGAAPVPRSAASEPAAAPAEEAEHEVDAGAAAGEPDAAPAPQTPEQLFTAAWDAMRRGDVGEAAEGFAQVEGAAGAGALVEDAAYWRAVALGRAGRRAQAEGAMRGFLDAHGSSSRRHEVEVMLAWLLYERGERAEAKELFARGSRAADPRVRASAEEGLGRP